MPLYDCTSAAEPKRSRRLPIAAIRRGTITLPAPGRESKIAKSGCAFTIVSISLSRDVIPLRNVWIIWTITATDAVDEQITACPE